MVKDKEAFLGFVEANVAKLPGLLFCHRFTEKYLLGKGIGKTPYHRGVIVTKKENASSVFYRIFTYLCYPILIRSSAASTSDFRNRTARPILKYGISPAMHQQ
jgi:hypothetical protein